MVIPLNLISVLMFWTIFQTSLWEGSLRMRSLVISGTGRSSRVSLCWVSSDVVSGHLWHWVHTYLHMRVMLVLKRPSLDLMTPSSLLSMLRPMVPELLFTSILPLWPVVFGLGKCLGVLLVEPFLVMLHSFPLPELLCVPSCMLGMSAFPSLGGFLVSLRASGTPWGRRFLNPNHGDTLGMLDSAGTAGSFCLEWSVGKASPV